MNRINPGLPQPGEYNPAFAVYISKAQSSDNPVETLDDQLSQLLSLLERVDEGKLLYRYAPGKWSVKEVLGHMIDTERVFAYRALRISRSDKTPLPSFDHDGYVVASQADLCDWSELLEEFEHVRRSTILMFRRLPEDAWLRTGRASNASISVRALAHVIIGHVTHHLDLLKERYL